MYPLDAPIAHQQPVGDLVGRPIFQRRGVGLVHRVAIFRMNGVEEGLVGGAEPAWIDFEQAKYLIAPGQLSADQIQRPTADVRKALGFIQPFRTLAQHLLLFVRETVEKFLPPLIKVQAQG